MHENAVIAWALQREERHHVGVALHCLVKVHIENDLVTEVGKILNYAKGVPFLKKKRKDVRPVTIFDSVLRIIDNLAVHNIEEGLRHVVCAQLLLGHINVSTFPRASRKRRWPPISVTTSSRRCLSACDNLSCFGCLSALNAVCARNFGEFIRMQKIMSQNCR